MLADGVLDATRLGELLDTEVAAPADGRERFGLMWAGKHDAVRSLLTPSRGTLVPELDKSIDFDTAENVFIEGDNLEVLKLLQKAYNDRVKLIYIDPPYNTGNDFVYNDDFADGLRGYLEYTGQLDDEGNRTSADADTLGRRHSRWLSMMYPRLVLARNLLTQDGVIFVSIDDNEVANLRAADGRDLRPGELLANVIWQTRCTPARTTSRTSRDDHELRSLVLRAGIRMLEREAASADRRARQGVHESRRRSTRHSGERGDRPKPAATTANGCAYDDRRRRHGERSSRRSNGMALSERRFDRLDDRSRIGEIVARTMSRDRPKSLPRGVRRGASRKNVWRRSDVGVTRDAKNEMAQRDLLGATSVFDTPKPTRLIRRCCSLATSPTRDDVVLDFFAGSGTTAHAVALQNAEDGGDRRVHQRAICPSRLPRLGGCEAGYDTCLDITRARIAAVDRGRRGRDGAGPAGRSASTRATSAATSDASRRAVRPQRVDALRREQPTATRIAAEVLLKEGVPLDAPWERHDGWRRRR